MMVGKMKRREYHGKGRGELGTRLRVKTMGHIGAIYLVHLQVLAIIWVSLVGYWGSGVRGCESCPAFGDGDATTATTRDMGNIVDSAYDQEWEQWPFRVVAVFSSSFF